MSLYFVFSCADDANTTNWILLIPSGPLSKSITGSQYVIILVIHIVQTYVICSTQGVVDSFFFNVTMHLAGQLEVLRNKFQTFANERNTEANYRKKFIGLVNRHNELIELYQNLEDTFNLYILFQLVTVTIMLALMGNI